MKLQRGTTYLRQAGLEERGGQGAGGAGEGDGFRNQGYLEVARRQDHAMIGGRHTRSEERGGQGAGGAGGEAGEGRGAGVETRGIVRLPGGRTMP